MATEQSGEPSIPNPGLHEQGVESELDERDAGLDDADEGDEEDGEFGFLRFYNQEFEDLTWIDVETAEEVLDLERQLVVALPGTTDEYEDTARFLAGQQGYDTSATSFDSIEFFCEGSDAHRVFGVADAGVSSSVAALAAAGCVPYASCNGGVFGNSHFEQFPLVAFLPESSLELVENAASFASLEINTTDPGLIISSDSGVLPMLQFAERLISLIRSQESA